MKTTEERKFLAIAMLAFLPLGLTACGGAERATVTGTGVVAKEVSTLPDPATAPEALPSEAVPDASPSALEPQLQPVQPPDTNDVVVTGDSDAAAVTVAEAEVVDLVQVIDASESVVEPTWWQPKASENLQWQWQLQGKLDTSLPVQVYNIDIEVPQQAIDDLRSRGVKLICYFSAGTVESFRDDADLFAPGIIGEQYEDLIDERWLDYAEIDALAGIMRARLDKCKSKGFDAVEIDNVDAHNYESRNENGDVVNIGTNFQMTLDESIAYVLWLAEEAHSRGLGIGLKNAEEMVPDVVNEVDWMLVEDCYYDSWCMAATAFIDADKPVFMAEYDDLVPDFTPACELAKSLGFSAIWRDSSLATRLYLACE